MRVRHGLALSARRLRGERGAVVPIVALSLIAMFGVIVLTVDVGGLLYERRQLVNSSDAAALAAAQSCAATTDTDDPGTVADQFAIENETDLIADNGGIIDSENCDSTAESSGYVTVRYELEHPLFFAGALGFGDSADVATEATAAWGPLASAGNTVPIVLDSGQLQGVCKVPDGIQKDELCAFWYNNGDETLGDASWGFLNLKTWNADPGYNCNNQGGTSDLGDYIVNGFGEQVLLNGDPPGSVPTYVCDTEGHRTTNFFDDLYSQKGKIKLFPVNDCEAQLDKSGNVAPCPETPDKYAIIGFTNLLVLEVYRGNDAAAVGTQGASGSCSTAFNAPTDPDGNGDVFTGQFFTLEDLGTSNACFSGTPDSMTNLKIAPKKGPDYAACATPTSTGCDYYFDGTTVTWLGNPTVQAGQKEQDDDLHISFDWAFSGTDGACGQHKPDPNAICLVTQWKGFTTSPGTVGGSVDFGVKAVKLCDRELETCPDQD